MQEKQITALFREKGLRATPQRIAVYKYLFDNRIHPDVEQIYSSVVKANPSFSRTTVYNSVRTLQEQGFIKAVTIDSSRIRYDANVKTHGHFICRKCSEIFDFDIEAIKHSGMDDFDIECNDVYCSGLCPECK